MTNEDKARQFYIFWHKMLGYPGISNARLLIRNFTSYRRFDWGKYKGECIADIIMCDRQYIQWCFDNIPGFELTDEEKALFSAGENGYKLGGYKTEMIGDTCYDYFIEGDSYDKDFIDSEIEKIKKYDEGRDNRIY